MIGLHPAIQTPERLSLTCALGLRFFDVATSTFVTADGLSVRAWPVGVPWQAVDGIPTLSGIIAFHQLPGLRKFERSAAKDPWDPEPATRLFEVELTDLSGRYLPCTFVVQAPAKGLAILADAGSPPWIEGGVVPLFSTPSRGVLGGLAVVRAELREFTSQEPAGWAFVEAEYSSGGLRRTARGLADDKGRVILMFAYPEGQRRAFNASPPGGARGISQQEWTLDLRFFYKSTSNPEDSPPNALIRGPEPTADYALRLAQPSVSASRDASPLTAVVQETLRFGRELDLGIIDLVAA